MISSIRIATVLLLAAACSASPLILGRGGSLNGGLNGLNLPDTSNMQAMAAGRLGGWDFASGGLNGLASAFAGSKLASLSDDAFASAAADPTPGGFGRTMGGAVLRGMFNDWQDKFAPSFGSELDRQAAFQNFASNMASVKEINLAYASGQSPFFASGNAYSGMSFSQFAKTVLMSPDAMASPPVMPSATSDMLRAPDVLPGSRKLRQATTTPKAVNWVASGKVAPVRNQGACGSCWAFAAASAIESSYLINVKNDSRTTAANINLSEQQLVSCVNSANGPYVSYGCNGGFSDEAMKYAAMVNVTTEARYPYGSRSSACDLKIVRGSTNGTVVRPANLSRTVFPNHEPSLMAAVATSPTVVYFAVDRAFQMYGGGIYSSRTCAFGAVNHAMVVVGYVANATTAAGRHWIIRNSWGATWGEKGYARVAMTGTGTPGPCRMYNYAYLPSQSFTRTLA